MTDQKPQWRNLMDDEDPHAEVVRSPVLCSECGRVGYATASYVLVPFEDESGTTRLGPMLEPFFFECTFCGWYATESELEFTDPP